MEDEKPQTIKVVHSISAGNRRSAMIDWRESPQLKVEAKAIEQAIIKGSTTMGINDYTGGNGGGGTYTVYPSTTPYPTTIAATQPPDIQAVDIQAVMNQLNYMLQMMVNLENRLATIYDMLEKNRIGPI